MLAAHDEERSLGLRTCGAKGEVLAIVRELRMCDPVRRTACHAAKRIQHAVLLAALWVTEVVQLHGICRRRNAWLRAIRMS